MIGTRSHRKLSRRGLLVPVTFPRDPLHELNGKWALRSGMGCKAQKRSNSRS